MKRSIAVAGLVAGVLAGAVGASVLTPIHLVGAAESAPSDDVNHDGHPRHHRVASWVADALGPLIDAGTLEQAQVDAVTEALVHSLPTRNHGDGHMAFDEVAELLGISVEELHQALRDGQTLAEVGSAHDVEPDAIIGVLVAALEDRLTEAVANAQITQERADQIVVDATDRISAFVHGDGPGPGERGRHGGHLRDRLQDREAA